MSYSFSRPALYGLVAALLTAFGLHISASPVTALDTDIGGNWNYNMSVSGLGSFSCYSQNQHSGASVDIDIFCNLVGSGVLIGSFEKSTGSFDAFGSVGSQQMQIFGNAPDDFNMSGTVSLSQSGSGTFSGFRDTPFVGGVAELTGAHSAGASTRPALDSNAALIASAIGGALLATVGVPFGLAAARRARR